MKDIVIDHKDISNSQTITPIMERKFKEAGLNMHHHEVTDLHDDFDRGVRKLTVHTPRLFFTVPELPWKKG